MRVRVRPLLDCADGCGALGGGGHPDLLSSLVCVLAIYSIVNILAALVYLCNYNLIQFQ